VPLVVTVLGDVVLPSSHRIPVPPLPGEAVMVVAPQYVPPALVVGLVGTLFTAASTGLRDADRQPVVVLRASA
jgi:hypothetical protein